jgi:hypothetical protein
MLPCPSTPVPPFPCPDFNGKRCWKVVKEVHIKGFGQINPVIRTLLHLQMKVSCANVIEI